MSEEGVGDVGGDEVDVSVLVPSDEAAPDDTVEEIEDVPDEEPASKPAEKEKKPAPKAKVEAKEEKKDEEPPKPKPKRIVKGKVDGVEAEIELDDEDSRRLSAKQMLATANKRLEEASKLAKQLAQVQQGLKTDPVAALKAAGVDLLPLAKSLVLADLKKNGLSPEERAAVEREEALSQREQALKAQEEERTRHAEEEEQRQAIQNLDREIARAAKEAGIHPSPHAIARIAFIMRGANEADYDMDPADAAEQAKEDMIAENKALFANLDGDDLLSALGDDVVEKVRKTLVARIKAKRGESSQPKVVEPQKTPEGEAPRKDKRMFVGSASEAIHRLGLF